MIDYNKILEVSTKSGGVSMRKLQILCSGDGRPVMGGSTELRRAVDWLEHEGLVKRYINGLVSTTPKGKKVLKERDVDLLDQHQLYLREEEAKAAAPASDPVEKEEVAEAEPRELDAKPTELSSEPRESSSEYRKPPTLVEQQYDSSPEEPAPAAEPKPEVASSEKAPAIKPLRRFIDPFIREHRYCVVKLKHLDENQKEALRRLLSPWNLPPLECVVVESDWPNYEDTWRAVERVASGDYVSLDDQFEELEHERRRIHTIVRAAEKRVAESLESELRRVELQRDNLFSVNEQLHKDIRSLEAKLPLAGGKETADGGKELATDAEEFTTSWNADSWNLPREDELEELVLDDLLALSTLGDSAADIVRRRLRKHGLRAVRVSIEDGGV